jgi:hypothetical protein
LCFCFVVKMTFSTTIFLIILLSIDYCCGRSSSNSTIRKARRACLQEYANDVYGSNRCFRYADNKILMHDLELQATQRKVVSYGNQTIISSLVKSSMPNSVYIYIHTHVTPTAPLRAAVVLDKILDNLRNYGLMQVAERIFICVYGPVEPIYEVISFYSNTAKSFTVLPATSEFASFFEFPTLTILHQHSKQYHPNSTILYMHTKGTTAMKDDKKSYWRSMMIAWNIGMHEYQRTLLHNGWLSSGLLLYTSPWPHYSGNYFWAQAGYIAQKPSLDTLIWHWRYGAERWLLSEQQEYCRNYHAEWNRQHFPFPELGSPATKIFKYLQFNTTNSTSFYC